MPRSPRSEGIVEAETGGGGGAGESAAGGRRAAGTIGTHSHSRRGDSASGSDSDGHGRGRRSPRLDLAGAGEAKAGGEATPADAQATPTEPTTGSSGGNTGVTGATGAMAMTIQSAGTAADLLEWHRHDAQRTATDLRVSRPGHEYKDRALHCGWLLKRSSGLIKRWQKRWFVLLANGELRYYREKKNASFGTVPLKESGGIPLALITAATAPAAASKKAGRRLDVVYERFGKSKYPGEYVVQAKSISSATLQATQKSSATMMLRALSDDERRQWLDTLQPLIAAGTVAGYSGGDGGRRRTA